MFEFDNGAIRLTPNYSMTVALPLMTIFWSIVAIVGIAVPFVLRKYKHKLTLSVALVTTAICCYIFWLFAFLAQLNPLIGPIVESNAAAHIRRVWTYSEPPGGISSDVEEHCFPKY